MDANEDVNSDYIFASKETNAASVVPFFLDAANLAEPGERAYKL